jgi:anaerobic selenocysteine-containing dehydrogenase
VWGANRIGPHQHEHWLPEAPGRVVVVDAVSTPTARDADLHLQPFPGSDAALASSIANVIRREAIPEQSRALLCWNINIAASNPQQARLRRALTRDDLLTVVIDLFPTDTTDLADFVLPAASFLERDDLVASYFHLTLSAQVKAIEPLGESLPNTEIFRRLAAAIRFDEPELQESDAQAIEHLLRGTGLGLDFAQLSERGTVWAYPEPSNPVRGPAVSGAERKDRAGFVERGKRGAPARRTAVRGPAPWKRSAPPPESGIAVAAE